MKWISYAAAAALALGADAQTSAGTTSAGTSAATSAGTSAATSAPTAASGTSNVATWGLNAEGNTGNTAVNITSFQDFGIGHADHGLFIFAADTSGNSHYEATIEYTGASTDLEVVTLHGPLVSPANGGASCTADADCNAAGGSTCGTDGTCSACTPHTAKTAGQNNGNTGWYGDTCQHMYYTPHANMYAGLCGNATAGGAGWSCGTGMYELKYHHHGTRAKVNVVGNIIALHNMVSCDNCSYGGEAPTPFTATVTVSSLTNTVGAHSYGTRGDSFVDPGLGHENHQLLPFQLLNPGKATFLEDGGLPLSCYTGWVSYMCTEPVQIAELRPFNGNPTIALDTTGCDQNFYTASGDTTACQKMYWTPVATFGLALDVTNVARFPLIINNVGSSGNQTVEGSILAFHTFTEDTFGDVDGTLYGKVHRPFSCWFQSSLTTTTCPAPPAPTTEPTLSGSPSTTFGFASIFATVLAIIFSL